MKTYWRNDKQNFGDQLTPWLMDRYEIPLNLVSHKSKDLELVGVGSILQFTPEDFSGYVWGSGILWNHQYLRPNAQFLAVRGRRTRILSGAPENTPLGDGSLLVPLHIERPNTKHALGIVPHKIHQKHPLVTRFENVKMINVRENPTKVITDIASCAAILTTSLHGLIVADAFGIPAVWSILDIPLSGGGFKFLDHETAVGENGTRRFTLTSASTVAQVVAKARVANASKVATAQGELELALDVLKGR